MIEWVVAKMAAGWVKVLVVVAALLMPICAVGWAWEGVALHGLSIPFPVIGPFTLMDGAIKARDDAIAARDLAIRDRDIYKGNADRLGKGLDRCNASVDGLAAAAKKFQDAAQALVDQRLKEQREYQSRIAAVSQIKPTDAQCPSVDKIFSTGFGP